MKKIIITALSFLLTGTQTPVVKQASAVIKESETMNIEEVYNQAKMSRSVIDDNEINVTLSNEDNTTVYELAAYKVNSNEDLSDTYVMAVPGELFSDSEIDTYALGDEGAGKYDNSYSVYAAVSYTYDERISNGYTGYLLKTVSGSWQIKDSSVTLSNKNVLYACTGLTFSGTLNSSQRVRKYISPNSYSYNTGFSTYVINDGFTSTMGVTSEVTLKHGGSSTWTLTVDATKF